MKDPEFILLRNRFLLGIGICMVLLIPFFLFFFVKLNQDDSKVVQMIKQKETFFLLITDKNTPSSYKKEVKKNGLRYEFLSSENNQYYTSLLRTLDIPKTDVITPSMMYIQEGELKSTLNDISKKEDISIFINNFKGGVE